MEATKNWVPVRQRSGWLWIRYVNGKVDCSLRLNVQDYVYTLSDVRGHDDLRWKVCFHSQRHREIELF